jgi:beta-glucosidase
VPGEKKSCTWQVPEVNLTPDVLLIHPYVGIRYDSISLSGIRAVLHTLYHSSTAPKELTGFLNRCKAEGVTCYILPCDAKAYHYETTTELLRGGAIPLSGMTEERAYMCLLMKAENIMGGNHMDIEKIISEMTLAEKAAMVSGRGCWWTKEYPDLGVSEVQVSDGPHGVRKMYPIAEDVPDGTIVSVCFPAACATASSFDTEMMEEMGSILGKECQAENVAVLLGPAVNIKRSPLCGRNFEYLSEDPYLAGKLSASYIRGVQKEGVGTSIKHFAANNQEYERMFGDSVADERTLREIYLPAFEIAVKESDPWTVMCSYNRVNGTYASENHWLLTEVLRDDWGYTGAVMSDWGAVSDRVAGLNAGLDLEMPDSGGTNDLRIIKAVQDGTLPEEKLDEAVRNVLGFVKKAVEARREEVFDREADHQKAVEIAKDCIVLLKNEGNVLPLSKEDKVAVIGGFAKTPRYQGGGSSHIKSFKVVSFLDAAAEAGLEVTYAEGFPADRDEISDERFSEAISAAEGADKILVFAGLPDLFESEGYDREHMRLPICQNQLIEKLITLGKPLILVLHNGSPIEMPWADSVAGIVESYLAGEGVGEAQRDIFYGVTNPSGKLAESFPIKLSDNPSFLNFPGMGHKVNYAEGVFVGYRYYDTKQMAVRFPFGFGLSYTEFRYSNMRVSRDHFTAAEGVTVSVDVTNIGEREGKEVVQLYVSDETKTAIRPVHELKGFVKLSLKPGETKTATFTLGMRDFAWYDEEIAGWYAANGAYKIEVGSSSRDIKYSAEVNIIGSKERPPVITQDVQIGELLASSYTRDFTKAMLDEKFKTFANRATESDSETPEMLEAVMKFMPLRGLRSFLGVTNEEIEGLCEALKEQIKKQMQ